jgi:starch phosphorylase
MERATNLAAWKSLVKDAWPEVKVLKVTVPDMDHVHVEECFEVQAQLQLGDLTPEDVSVELYLGPVDASGEIIDPKIVPLIFKEKTDTGTYIYQASVVTCEKSGLFGYTVRVLPHHPDLVSPFIPDLITWA